MALPVIPNVMRVSLEWTPPALTKAAANVLHFSWSGTPAALKTVIDNHVTQAMWAPCIVAAAITEMRITPLDGVSSAEVFSLPAVGKWAGSTPNECIPQAAALVSLSTGLRGPANRGRIYLPYLGEGAQSNGSLNAAPALTTAWQNFYVACLADLAVLGVASYKHSNFHAAIAQTARVQAGTQRRRQRR